MTLKLVKKEGSDNEEASALAGLNPEQKKAVQVIGGPVLVVAGAGSGKTRVLTQRIAHLIENGIAPWNILALTFTNKAANEMKERIGRIISQQAASKVWAGTFHSVFARILRREAEALGYKGNFSIYDTDDSLSSIKKIMNRMNISQQQVPPQAVRSRISWAKNRMISWQEYSNSADSPADKKSADIYEHYEKYLFTNNAMDFDDLLINMINLLNSSKSLLEKYQDMFKYILVDEYQDTNRAQFNVLNMLAQKHRNICVVGDDAQSIYRWRGAEIKNILDFEKIYSGLQIVRLEQNYRSTKTILAAADSVIKRNRKQIPKTLWTDNEDGEKIEILRGRDDREEAEKIVQKIHKMIGSDEYQSKDFAILYRTNAQSLPFENWLRYFKIPYIIVGGMSFFKRKEVKDVIAYLKMLVNPDDSESLLRVINEPPRGIGATSLSHITNFAAENGISVFEAFKHIDRIPDLKSKAINSITAFIQMIDKFRKLMEEQEPSDLVRDYINETGLIAMYIDMGTDEAEERIRNIDQILTDIASYFNNFNALNDRMDGILDEGQDESTELKRLGLEDYLQQVTLVSDVDQADMTHNHVKIMTLHSAKGLEFPVVFLAGLEQGLFPLQKAEMHPDEEEEERRLFYVGITRAEKKLFISHADRRMKFGEIQSQVQSKFIKEIDYHCIKNGAAPLIQQTPQSKPKPLFVDTSSSGIPKPSTSRFAYSQAQKTETYSQVPATENIQYDTEFKPGDRVSHAHFGSGKVVAIAGMGANRQILIDFKSVGKKRLMIQYAKLVKIN
jgi:DNA helicase II / ATP-dependent DNA helicase PcrA